MKNTEMFKGLNREEWESALSEQRDYLKDKYNHDILENKTIDAKDLNEKAAEAQKFLKALSEALINGWKVTDDRLTKILEDHISFLNSHGISTDKSSLAVQAKFFLEDDFHRNMLETQQVGLCYYFYAAAQAYDA